MKIVVLAGGTSSERNVSLISGKGIYNALLSKNHQVILLDVYLGYDGNTDNIFEVQKDWSEGIEAIGEELPDLDQFKKLRKGDSKCFFGPGVLEICKQADIVFMGLHGMCGEDGRIQATFELLGIPFTGTDYLSSAICMDKALTKELFNQNGIPNARGYSISTTDKPIDIGYPVVVKVNTGGSSVGVYICNNEAEVTDALKKAEQYDHKVVIEQYIKGREFTCGLIDGKALPVLEIAPKEGFYNFSNKYQAGKTNDICPAVLSEAKTLEIQHTAEKAYRVLRLSSYARIDFMMDEEENIYCLEANTLPGMTPVSLLPQEAAVIGLDYPELCEKLIEVSLKSK